MNHSNKRTRGEHKQRNTLPPSLTLPSFPPFLPPYPPFLTLPSFLPPVAGEMRVGRKRRRRRRRRENLSENASSLKGKTTPCPDLSPAGVPHCALHIPPRQVLMFRRRGRMAPLYTSQRGRMLSELERKQASLLQKAPQGERT